MSGTQPLHKVLALPSLTAMEALSKPHIQEIMRAPPSIPIERIDSMVYTSTEHQTQCRLYNTPKLSTPTIKHPGTLLLQPTAPRPLPRRKRGDTTKTRQFLKKHYNKEAARYNIILEAFQASPIIRCQIVCGLTQNIPNPQGSHNVFQRTKLGAN